jgi:hypothetical protein
MAKGPEANFWTSLRHNLPRNSFANRIENKAGGGVPDVHMMIDGLPFWLELKVSKGFAVSVSGPQVAWHVANWAHGGLSFFLVKALGPNKLYLYPGCKAPELAREGLRSEAHIAVFSRSNQVFDGLRPCVLAHYSAALQRWPASCGPAASDPAPRPCDPAANDGVAPAPQ